MQWSLWACALAYWWQLYPPFPIKSYPSFIAIYLSPTTQTRILSEVFFLLKFFYFVRKVIFQYDNVGFGIDCYLLSMPYFIAQIIISLFLKTLTTADAKDYIFILGAVFGLISFIYAKFIAIFPKNYSMSRLFKKNK